MNFAEIKAALPRTAVTTIEDLPFPKVASGKVREIFDLGDALLLVASDRLSAFDVILPDGIPGKGAILTQMSNWWFAQTGGLIPNHLLPDQAALLAEKYRLARDLQLRSMVVKKLKPLAIECVVRGYLAGSGWSSYQKNGEVCGIPLPAGLRQADRLPQPIFTPTTKAPKGEHDAPINDAQAAGIVGAALYEKVKSTSLALYRLGHERAKQAGMILADSRYRDSSMCPTYSPGCCSAWSRRASHRARSTGAGVRVRITRVCRSTSWPMRSLPSGHSMAAASTPTTRPTRTTTESRWTPSSTGSSHRDIRSKRSTITRPG